MARKNVGKIDETLLNRVDQAAGELGQTRRVFVERAVEAALSDTQERVPPSRLARPSIPPTGGVRPAVPAPAHETALEHQQRLNDQRDKARKR